MEIKIEITCSCGRQSMLQLLSDQKEYTCNACGSQLFKAHISTGYVYVLSNPSMPDLVKIGFTERDVLERLGEMMSEAFSTLVRACLGITIGSNFFLIRSLPSA